MLLGSMMHEKTQQQQTKQKNTHTHDIVNKKSM